MRLLLICASAAFACFAFSQSSEPAPTEITSQENNNYLQLKNRIDALEENIKALKAPHNPADNWFLDLHMSTLKPISSSFKYPSDLGLGASAGLGRYWGDWRITGVNLDYDMFVALNPYFVFVHHFSKPQISFGFRAGSRFKLFRPDPFDNFISKNERFSFFTATAGVQVMFPINKNIVSIVWDCWASKQDVIVLRLGLQALDIF